MTSATQRDEGSVRQMPPIGRGGRKPLPSPAVFSSGYQRRLIRFGALALAGSLIFLTACGGDDDDGGGGGSSGDGENAGGDETTDSSTTELREGAAWVLHAQGGLSEVPVYANEGDTEPAQVIANPNPDTVTQSPVVFLVDTTQGEVDPSSDEYIPVWLPMRPNQSKGWVRADDIVPSQNDYLVRIEVAARRLVVLKNGEQVLETAAGVGRAGRETPQGTYFVRESIQVADDAGNPTPDGDYGPYAFGISGFSDDPQIIAEFGENSSVGIHGTNDPSTIGQEVSSGCIRIPNDIVTEMAVDDPNDSEDIVIAIGTPIEIVP